MEEDCDERNHPFEDWSMAFFLKKNTPYIEALVWIEEAIEEFALNIRLLLEFEIALRCNLAFSMRMKNPRPIE